MPDFSQILQNLPKQYNEHIAENPLLQVPLYTAAGAVAGNVGSDALASMLVRLTMATRPAQEREMLVQQLRDSGRIKALGTLLGAAGGFYLAGNQHWDTQHGISNFFQSLANKNYWNDNPDFAKARKEKNQNATRDSYYSSQVSPDSFGKKASFDFSDPLGDENDSIPIRHSLDLLNRDEFLNPFEKQRSSSIFLSAENSNSGLTSPTKLAQGALRMGIGFLPAYAFGQGVGKILALPPPVSDRISTIGGLAAAVKNSGIF